MSTAPIELLLLGYLADEEFCSSDELETVAQAVDANADQVQELLESWRIRGWLESVLGDGPGAPEWLRLTDAGVAAARSQHSAG
jgi:hypothetical protein